MNLGLHNIYKLPYIFDNDRSNIHPYLEVRLGVGILTVGVGLMHSLCEKSYSDPPLPRPPSMFYSCVERWCIIFQHWGGEESTKTRKKIS